LIDESDIVSTKKDSSLQKIIARLWELNPKMKIVGGTGSPFRLDQGALHHDTQDGPALFTECCYWSDPHKMIKNGWWSTPKYLTPGIKVDLEGVPLAGRDYNTEIMGVKFHAIVEHAVKDMKAQFAAHEIETAIIFASSIKNGKEIVDLWGNENEIRLLHGELSKTERREILLWLIQSHSNRYIVNVGILIRGFNYPALGAVVFFTATKSTAKYIQAGGRVVRACEGKKFGYILDYGTNVERHGKIEDIEPADKPKRRGDAPKKMCLNCYEPNLLSARKCVKCEMVFVISDNDDGLYSMKSQAEIDEEKSLIEYEIGFVSYHSRLSQSGIKMLVSEFWNHAGKSVHKHNILLDHSGKAKLIADQYIKSLFKNEKDYYKVGSIGRNVDNMLLLLQNRPEFFKRIAKIATGKGQNKYRELKQIELES
jgi:DNA repair protein RadD